MSLETKSPQHRLILAAQMGDVRAIRHALKEGANIDERDEGGKNALHWAILGRHFEAVGCLLLKGADVNLPTGNVISNTANSRTSMPPLQLTFPRRDYTTEEGRLRSYSMAQLLLAAGADPCVENKAGDNTIAASYRVMDEIHRQREQLGSLNRWSSTDDEAMRAYVRQCQKLAYQCKDISTGLRARPGRKELEALGIQFDPSRLPSQKPKQARLWQEGEFRLDEAMSAVDIEHYLAQGLSPNARNDEGEALLGCVAQTCRTSGPLLALLHAGADVEPLLHIALKRADRKLLGMALAADPTLTVSADELETLHYHAILDGTGDEEFTNYVQDIIEHPSWRPTAKMLVQGFGITLDVGRCTANRQKLHAQDIPAERPYTSILRGADRQGYVVKQFENGKPIYLS